VTANTILGGPSLRFLQGWAYSCSRRVAHPLILAWAIDTEGGPSLRFLQGRVRCCRYYGICHAYWLASHLRRGSSALHYLLVTDGTLTIVSGEGQKFSTSKIRSHVTSNLDPRYQKRTMIWCAFAPQLLSKTQSASDPKDRAC